MDKEQLDRLAQNEGLFARLEKSMTNHRPNEDRIRRIEQIREDAKELAHRICANTHPSREQSLAATHLEETVMWAVKAIVLEDVE